MMRRIARYSDFVAPPILRNLIFCYPMAEAIEGWKKIAEYFGRGTRTVQVWERESGLPVHRLQKRVLAYTNELEEWRKKHTEIAQGAEDENGADAPVATEPGTRRLIWTAVAALAIGLAAIGSARLLSSPGPVVGVRVVQNTLTALGPDGREVWRHVFPTPLDAAAYERDWGFKRPWLAFDVRGDGSNSLLFRKIFASTGHGESLVSFDARGRKAWEFSPGHTVVDLRSREFEPPYFISATAAIKSGSSKTATVVVSSLHNWSFPDQIVRLDAVTGHLLSEYWHRGHLNHMLVMDLDGDGEPEVILGGVNDSPEYARATLVVFDHRWISGSSTKPDGTPHFQGMAPGTEKAIVRFSKSPISQGLEFNRVREMCERDGHLVVTVSESTSEPQGPCVVYDLDRTLHPLNVGLCEDFTDRYLAMRRQDAKLPSPNDLIERLKRGVDVWWRK